LPSRSGLLDYASPLVWLIADCQLLFAYFRLAAGSEQLNCQRPVPLPRCLLGGFTSGPNYILSDQRLSAFICGKVALLFRITRDSGDSRLPATPPSSQSIPRSSQSVPSSSQLGRPNRSQPCPNRPNSPLRPLPSASSACWGGRTYLPRSPELIPSRCADLRSSTAVGFGLSDYGDYGAPGKPGPPSRALFA
jgi:hypothetical protein